VLMTGQGDGGQVLRGKRNGDGYLMGTPDPHHKLHEYMDGDDVGWPSLSRFGWETRPIWAHFIVILFI
jgi:hypothetical protein